jgi:hypothetical protein
LIFCLVVVSACDEGFDETNTNKTAVQAVDPIYQLNNAIVSVNGGGFAGGSPLIYDLGNCAATHFSELRRPGRG